MIMKKKILENRNKLIFLKKYYFLFIADQNCHIDCTYNWVGRNTYCTLQYCTINEGVYRCLTKILNLED